MRSSANDSVSMRVVDDAIEQLSLQSVASQIQVSPEEVLPPHPEVQSRLGGEVLITLQLNRVDSELARRLGRR